MFREATQGSVIQSSPGRLFPLEYCPSLPTCSYRPPGPHPNTCFVSIRGDTKSIITGSFVHRIVPLPTPLPTSSHASSANPFVHADTADASSAQGRPSIPLHLDLSRYPLRPWPLQRAHRLLRLCDPHHSQLTRLLELATWFKHHVSMQSSSGQSIIFRHASHWPEDASKIVQ